MRPYFSSLSEDPKGFDAGDYNLFRYCKNDPEDLTDPSGLFVLSGAPWLLQSNSGYEMDKMRPTLLVSAGSGAAEDKPIGNHARVVFSVSIRINAGAQPDRIALDIQPP